MVETNVYVYTNILIFYSTSGAPSLDPININLLYFNFYLADKTCRQIIFNFWKFHQQVASSLAKLYYFSNLSSMILNTFIFSILCHVRRNK